MAAMAMSEFRHMTTSFFAVCTPTDDCCPGKVNVVVYKKNYSLAGLHRAHLNIHKCDL